MLFRIKTDVLKAVKEFFSLISSDRKLQIFKKKGNQHFRILSMN